MIWQSTLGSMIPEDVRQRIDGTTLFYPCSGEDWPRPIAIFAPVITDFWFVDLRYFTSFAATRSRPLLRPDPAYELLDVVIEGPAIATLEHRTDEKTGKRYPWMEPCTRTERYRHRESGREVRIHRRRGFGPSAMRKHIQELGVFFYRGDSMGEGGSRTLWLTVRGGCVRLIDEVLERVLDGGLIVTDGANCLPEGNPYSEFGRFYQRQVGPEALSLSREFHDDRDNCFRCIGYAGQRYGPTLVWQVEKASPAAIAGTAAAAASGVRS